MSVMLQPKIFLILPLLILASSCNNNKKDLTNKSPVPVLTDKVTQKSILSEISVSGNIEGNKTVRIGFMVAGRIDKITVNEGQQVFRNKLVASLDPSNYEIARELAEIQLNQTRDEYERLKLMHEKNSLSESDFAKITFGLQQANAQFKLHSKNLSETRLYSPIDGVLLKRLAEVGEVTGAGIPVLVVSDIHKVKVNAFIPEHELHLLKLGQMAKVFIPSLDKTFEGKITEVGSAADPASRAFSVKIEVENPQMLIRPGMIAEIKILTEQPKDIMVIPVEALLHDFNGVSYIYVFDSVKMKAFRRNITTGIINDNMIEVTSGISLNEIIVKGGQHKLVDGTSVIISK